jgi:DNA polymerase elongation subunit (family B)
MFQVNIVNTAAAPAIIRKHYSMFYIPDSFTIVTTSIAETLSALIQLIRNTRPDFMPGFNSLDFDLPQLLLALRVYNLFDTFYSQASVMNCDDATNFKYKYKYKGCTYSHNSGGYTYWANAKTTSQVSGISGIHKNEDKRLYFNNGNLPEFKIKPQEKKAYHDINIPGMIMIDIMLIAWKKDAKKATKGGGLNFYLKEYGFEPKIDIPYYKIWIYYGMTLTHDVVATPAILFGKCEHGFDCKHSYIDPRDDCEYACKAFKQYWLGNKPIDRGIYKILGGKSLIENIRLVAVYCSYDAKGSMLLLKKFNFMEEKRKYCVYVNMIPHKVIYLADMNKAENGLRKTIQDNNYVFIEEKLVVSNEGDNRSDVKRLLAANPRLERYHANRKAPKNKGGHCEIKMRGRISDTFEIPISDINIENSADISSNNFVDTNGIITWLKENKVTFSILPNKNLAITLPMPVEGIDFASLYPNLIMAFNLCKTKITFNLRDIELMQKLDPTITYTTIPVAEVLADSDLPDEICRYYETVYGISNFANENIYIINHGCNPAKYGILPKFMSNFFDKRKAAKGLQARATNFADDSFELHLDNAEFQQLYEESNGKYKSFKDFLQAYLFANDEAFRNWTIEIINQEGCQLAIKITMNSTYGTLDTIHSVFYSSIVAMLITFLGRRFIKISGQYCTDNACTVVYHDTDSTYFHHNKSLFEDIVLRFVKGEISKEDLHRKFVMRSIKATLSRYQINEHYKNKLSALSDRLADQPRINDDANRERIRIIEAKMAALPDKTFIDKLNDLFAERSGSRFLSQVREETLFPALYFMLKKYFGVIHTTKYNAKPAFKDLLFRGIKIRQGNCTDYLKEFIERIVWRIINEDDTYNIVFEELRAELASKPDYSNIRLYENTARFKSDKKNSVASLVTRMNAKRDSIIDPKLQDLHRAPFELESILYINTKPKQLFDITGKKVKSNKQDLAEYSRVVEYLYRKHLKTGCDYYEINMQDYVMSTISTCSQFLSFDPRFEGYYEGIIAKDYVKIIRNYLKKYCKDYYSNLPENIAAEEERLRYRKYLSANKTIFADMIAVTCNLYGKEYYNIYSEDRLQDSYYASVMLGRMINLNQGISFGTKLKNIASCGFESYGRFGNTFYRRTICDKIYRRTICDEFEMYNREDLNAFRTQLLQYEEMMDTIIPYLEELRDVVIPRIFTITRNLANRNHLANLPCENYENNISERLTDEERNSLNMLTTVDIVNLIYAEMLFRQYCGWMTFTTGTIKNYYVNTPIDVPDL